MLKIFDRLPPSLKLNVGGVFNHCALTISRAKTSRTAIGCLCSALFIAGCTGQPDSSSSANPSSSSSSNISSNAPASSAPSSSALPASSSSQASSSAPLVDTFGLQVKAITVTHAQSNTPITVDTTTLNNASLSLVRKAGGTQ